MQSSLSFSVRPYRVLGVLLGLIVVLGCFSVAGQFAKFYLGHGRLLGFIGLFNLDLEHNIPANISVLMLLSASLLLGLIAVHVRKTAGKLYRYWGGLSLIFLYIAIDENNSYHERLIYPIQQLLDTSGFFHYAWIIPAIGVVAVLALVYARFLFKLPVRFRRLFVGSAILYLIGAVVMEGFGGMYASQYGVETFSYNLITTVEELFEMSGTALFLYALLEYLRIHAGPIQVTLESPSHMGQPSPD